MKRTDVAIIGAGQSGLAISWELMARGVDHTILERGEIANSWLHERWDSLHLLSTNRMNVLPGLPYDGDDSDGFMSVGELVTRFGRAARKVGFPVKKNTTVLSVAPGAGGFHVQTDQGHLHARKVVIASGACNRVKVPAFASALAPDIAQISPLKYRSPANLPPGNVLIVGASATGLQLAREVQLSGRQVTLAVGNHTRLPRRYREQDILEWTSRLGLASMPYTEVDDIARARRTPSPSLVAGATLDLNTLQQLGVEIVGRCVDMENYRAVFSGSLANTCATADLKMLRLLTAIDELCGGKSERGDILATRLPDNPRLLLDLKAEGIASVIWATGFKPELDWLKMPCFDRKGMLLHEGGLVKPGLYVMGLPFLRTRRSTLLAGAAADASWIAGHAYPCGSRDAAA